MKDAFDRLSPVLRMAGQGFQQEPRAGYILKVARTIQMMDQQRHQASLQAYEYVVMALLSLGARELARRFLSRLYTGEQPMVELKLTA